MFQLHTLLAAEADHFGSLYIDTDAATAVSAPFHVHFNSFLYEGPVVELRGTKRGERRTRQSR